MAVKATFKKPGGGTVTIVGADKEDVMNKYDRMFEQSQADAKRGNKDGEEATWGETAADVAKGVGYGALKGVASVPGMVGDIETLGRMGINYAGEKLGYGNDLVSEDAAAPTSSDVYSTVFEPIAGDYNPTTSAGRIAQGVTAGITGGIATAGAGGLISAGTRAALGSVARGGAAGALARTGQALHPAAAAGGAAGLASTGANEMGFGQGTQLAAGLVGGLAGAKLANPLRAGSGSRALEQEAQRARDAASRGNTAQSGRLADNRRAIQELEATGVKLTGAARADGSKWARTTEDTIDKVWGNNVGARKQRELGESLTKAAIKEAELDVLPVQGGRRLQEFDRVNSDFFQAARNHFNRAYEQIDQQLTDVDIGRHQPFWNSMGPALRRYELYTLDRNHLPGRLTRLMDDLETRSNPLDPLTGQPNPMYGQVVGGDQLRRWSSELGKIASEIPDSPAGQFAADLRANLLDALRDVQIQAGNQALVQLMDRTNRQYRNYLVLKNAGAKASATEGILSPAGLSTSANQILGNTFLEGSSQFGRFARNVRDVIKGELDSGTAERSNVISALNRATNANTMAAKEGLGVAGNTGAGTVGAGLGGAAGTLLGGPVGGAAGAAVGLAATGKMAGAVSKYMANRGANAANDYNPLFTNREQFGSALATRAALPLSQAEARRQDRQKEINRLMGKSKVWDRK